MLQHVKHTDPTGAKTLYLPDYFEGRTRAYGFFETPFGTLKRHFVVDIDGAWADERFRMEEYFVFDDGERDERTWWLSPETDGRFTAVCDEIIEPGKGRHDGNRCTLGYVIGLKVGGRRVAMRFQDLFVLSADGVLLNRAKVSKWGVPVGQLMIAFTKDY